MDIFTYMHKMVEAVKEAGGIPAEIHLNDPAWMALNSHPGFRSRIEQDVCTLTIKFEGLPILLSPRQSDDVLILSQ
jgi:hypothetical protein